MRFYSITSLLILFSALLLTVGCGERVEDGDANMLQPSADFHFQNLPILDGGSLIPLDEIPVITIQKTREDADFFYWQLSADPAPTHEDLVVGISLSITGLEKEDLDKERPVVKLKNLRTDDNFFGDFAVWNNVKLKDREEEFRLWSDSLIIEHSISRPDYIQFSSQVQSSATTTISRHSKDKGYFYDSRNSDLIIVIPRFKNTSLEFTLPHGFGHVVWKKDATYRTYFHPDDLPELPAVDNPQRRIPQSVFVVGEVAEDFILNFGFKLSVMSPWSTANKIINETHISSFDAIDLPVLQTFDGYIIREGFAFSYYQLGEISSLVIPSEE